MTHTKKQKLDWIKKVSLSVAKLLKQGYAEIFTCNEFDMECGVDSHLWYENCTLKAMGIDDPDERFLQIYDFGKWSERDSNRQMWLAMLQTLVEAGEF